MTRFIVGRKSDVDAIEAAYAEEFGAAQPKMLTAGALPVSDRLVWVGIDPPNHAYVNLRAPLPLGGDREGWMYFDAVAAYTEDLVAITGTDTPE